ncbi:ankyrin repeat domain-containing protein [Candidatus Latescibacterota bacterium]
MIRKAIPLLILILTFTGCIFQSDEKLKLKNTLDPNSDAYVEAGVSELNIESGQEFYTSDITVTWKGNTYAAEYQCVLNDSTYAWNTSSWIKLTDLASGEYLFNVTPRNQASFKGKMLDRLFKVLEPPAVENISIKNGQVFATPDMEITWTGNSTAQSYLCTLNDQTGEWSDATSVSFEGLADSVYTLTIIAKNEDFTGVPMTWTFIVDTSTTPRITITGNVTGTDEATVLLEGDASEARITVDDGTYSFNVTDGGTYTLIPQKQGYSFHPISVNLDEITTDITQDFTATLNTYTISGTVTGADDVAVQLTGDAEESINVDNGGSYSFTVDALGDYAIIPRRDGYSIIPGNSIYISLTQDIIQDFEVVKAGALTISGLINGLDDVTIRLSGDLENTQIVDDGDRYEFIVDLGGTYTLSVFKEECMFDVHQVTVENVIQSQVQNINGQLIPTDKKNLFLSYAGSGNTAQIQVMLDDMPLIHTVKDINGDTPLHKSAINGRTETVQLLLDIGADIEAKNNWGRSPLHEPYGNTETVRLLLDRGADIEATDNSSETPLHRAANFNKTARVQLLLDRGADIEAKDYHGWTPLHSAAGIIGNTETVQLLLDRGADIEAKDDVNGTPLHRAAVAGKIETVQLLLDRGANVNAADNFNKTPLDIAEEGDHTETAVILIAAGGKRGSEL